MLRRLSWIVLGMLLGAAALAAVFHRFALAGLLLVLALWWGRALWRRSPALTHRPTPSVTPMLTSALLALLLTALGVEASHLPVRFDQPGFAPEHWLWVLLAWAVLWLGVWTVWRRRAAARP